MKIAMWSGPRNLSTALMYAFANRDDCAAQDEPFYAAYLAETGLDHPMRADILAAHETRGAHVSDAITKWSGPTPHLYLKLMTFHMTPGMPMAWADDCVHVHLIRHPARVAASYGVKRDGATADDLGFDAGLRLYQHYPGPVIDSADLRRAPRKVLALLCANIGLPWSDAMLSWPPGPKAEDGVWAAHWYSAVHRSRGFAGAEGPLPETTPLAQLGLDAYHFMAERALK